MALHSLIYANTINECKTLKIILFKLFSRKDTEQFEQKDFQSLMYPPNILKHNRKYLVILDVPGNLQRPGSVISNNLGGILAKHFLGTVPANKWWSSA